MQLDFVSTFKCVATSPCGNFVNKINLIGPRPFRYLRQCHNHCFTAWLYKIENTVKSPTIREGKLVCYNDSSSISLDI